MIPVPGIPGITSKFPSRGIFHFSGRELITEPSDLQNPLLERTMIADHGMIAPLAPLSAAASAEPPPSKQDEVSLKTPSEMDLAPWNIL